ncbi:MAG TPA: hypothetical protein VN982_13680 [Candidatus Dormibacteraeota bacterium]|nr:hypothetical protein [Candidatus Dormibacteraeota bacterium]
MENKSKSSKTGTVEKIIKFPHPEEPEKAQIAVEGADDLYKEIRIENTFENEKGEKVKLKAGAHVDVTVEADNKETVPVRGKKLS